MHCVSWKEMWGKLQTHRRQFESSKKKDDENIAVYLLCVDEIVNTIRGLGEKVEDKMIVQKLIRSLSLTFDAKVFAIEEIKDLDKLTMDELHEILVTYEMTIEKEKSLNREAVFKAADKMNKEPKPTDSFDDE